MARLFGTDGVRGIANRELTPDLAYRLGYAGAKVLAVNTDKKPTILIGMDTRISCPMLEAALAAGICSAGADVLLCGVLPTPGIAYLASKYKYDAGVMISASHNSFEYNGIKFFSGNGFKLSDEIEDEIERTVNEYDIYSQSRPVGEEVGTAVKRPESGHQYIEHLKRRMSVDLTGMRIAIDCANGAASEIAPSLFEDLGATVIAIGNQPNGLNINKNCGSTHLEVLSQLVVTEKCDIGLAFDGDADRFLAIDGSGNLVDGDAIMSIIAMDMKENGELKYDTIVVTVMSNLGLDIMANENGIVLEKTKVGDRYVLEKMLEKGYNIGGEQSGHVILLDHATTGDGILTALALLKALYRRGQSLVEASEIIRILPQVLLSAKVKNEDKAKVMEFDLLKSTIEKYESQLNGKGRILVRASGTEPIIRVMIEGENEEEISLMARDLVAIIQKNFIV
ncbi:MAG: phosphoglucosamine mutase [Oscillospiraceae bacterium]|jgi:phosphoglucosamine mutase|nr:phosphoglucosamine mutase [Oscillospiraceae bacterium]